MATSHSLPMAEPVAEALHTATSALYITMQMAEAVERLLQEIGVCDDPETVALGYAAEACLFRIQKEAQEAVDKLDPFVPPQLPSQSEARPQA